MPDAPLLTSLEHIHKEEEQKRAKEAEEQKRREQEARKQEEQRSAAEEKQRIESVREALRAESVREALLEKERQRIADMTRIVELQERERQRELQEQQENRLIQAEEQEVSCPICCLLFRQPIKTVCGHFFCGDCMTRWRNTGKSDCPTCRKSLPRHDVSMCYVVLCLLVVVSSSFCGSYSSPNKIADHAMEKRVRTFRSKYPHHDLVKDVPSSDKDMVKLRERHEQLSGKKVNTSVWDELKDAERREALDREYRQQLNRDKQKYEAEEKKKQIMREAKERKKKAAAEQLEQVATVPVAAVTTKKGRTSPSSTTPTVARPLASNATTTPTTTDDDDFFSVLDSKQGFVPTTTAATTTATTTSKGIVEDVFNPLWEPSSLGPTSTTPVSVPTNGFVIDTSMTDEQRKAARKQAALARRKKMELPSSPRSGEDLTTSVTALPLEDPDPTNLRCGVCKDILRSA